MDAGVEMVSWRTVKQPQKSAAHFWLRVEQKRNAKTELNAIMQRGEGNATLLSWICYSAAAVVSIVYDNSSLNNMALIRQFPFTQMTTIQVNLVCWKLRSSDPNKRLEQVLPGLPLDALIKKTMLIVLTCLAISAPSKPANSFCDFSPARCDHRYINPNI